MAEIAAVAQVVGSVGMFGVIWMVQVVHYPLMRFVSGEQFARFETAHRARISWVVGPLMAVEGVCVLAFLFAPPAGLAWWLPWVGAGVEAITVGTVGGLTLILAGSWLAAEGGVPWRRRAVLAHT